MVEFPRLTYKTPDYLENLDEIFAKILKYETDYSKKLVELRKEQIRKHSKGNFIAETLNDLANLIGSKQDNRADIIMNMSHERLIELHSPVIFNIPLNIEPFHKWEEWTFEELADNYSTTMLMKGFEDRYVFDIINNRAWYGGEWTEGIKNYHVMDMLTDLVMYDSKICGYEFRSFMNDDDEDRLLKTFNQDSLIEVKLHEKMTIEEYEEMLGVGKYSRKNPVFKYKRIFKQNSSRLQQESNFLTEQIIKEAHSIPQELKDQYIFLGEQIKDMPFKQELDEWITCPHRMRRYIEGMGVLSFCTNPLHPRAEIGLWIVECSKKNCDLEKILDDPIEF